MKRKFELREMLSKQFILKGSGVEIGPTFLPVPLKKGVKVTYVDVMSKNDLLKLYPNLKGQPVVDIDVVDDGERLSKFKDESLDFVIANHFIEHTVDPIKTLKNFLRVLKENGIIFMAIPDKRATFDKDRALTPVAHFVEVHQKDADPLIDNHYHEVVKIVEHQPTDKVKKRIQELKDSKFSIHYHTFTKENFLPLINHMQSLKVPISLLKVVDLEPGTDEFIVVLQKNFPNTIKGLKNSIVQKIKSLLLSLA